MMQGKTIAILESRLGAQMVELVKKRGGVPVHAPALAEVPDVDPGRIAALVRDLESDPAKLAIFQTGVGTQALFKTTDNLGLTATLLAMLQNCVVAVRGPKPTAVLRGRQVRIDLSAPDPFTTAELLTVLRGVPLAGARVIVQRHGATNRELEDALHRQGAVVLEIPTYRWSLPDDTGPLSDLVRRLHARAIDAVAFTNAAQVHNLFAMAGGGASLKADLGRIVVASIGPVCTAALREHGVAATIEASPPKLGPLLAALDAALT